MIRVQRPRVLSLALPLIVYSILSIIILWSLILPGYILTLDMVFAPTIPFPRTLYGLDSDPMSLLSMPFRLVLWALNMFFPVWLIQKILLFSVFLVAGLSAYTLCQVKSIIGRLFAGFMYTLNPFVYVRSMVGHINLLLAYSILPFLIKLFVEFIDEPQLKGGIKIAFLSTLILIFDLHFVYVAGLLLLALFIFKVLSLKRSPQSLARLVGWSGAVAAIFMAINLYWVLPLFISNATNIRISGFAYQDLLAFNSSTWGTGLNIFFTLASLYGFWRIPEGYVYVSETLVGWQLVYFLILYLTVHGFISFQSTTSNTWIAKGFAVAGISSLILAAGISSIYTAPIFETLFKNLPLFSGMREPQKFLTVLALVYSFLGGHGISELHMAFTELKCKSSKHQAVKRGVLLMFIAVVLVSPFIYSYTQLFGFNGQLRSLEYPEEWYEVKTVLASDPSDFRILILPWHLYMYQSWIGRITVNPAPDFFDRPSLAGENMECMGIETQSEKSEQLYIHFLLPNRDKIENFGELLAPLNIKYIILLKEVDYQNYNFLYSQTDLKVILENTKIVLFENQHKTAKIYWVRDVKTVEDWNHLIEVSQDENLLTHLYLIEPEPASKTTLTTTFFRPLHYVKVSPIEFEIDVPEKGYIVFTEPYDEGWTINGETPAANLGLNNAFQIKHSGSTVIYYQKFNRLLPFYAASTIAFIGCVLCLARKSKWSMLPPMSRQGTSIGSVLRLARKRPKNVTTY